MHPSLKKIVIVGGGTAGWMTAMYMAKSLIPQGVEIHLLESPTVDIIGVGEGSTPPLQKFFEEMEIEEAEWMPECNATYKSGIAFENWSTKPGCESFFHTFVTMLDNITMPQFIRNAQARTNGVDTYAHPDRFFIAHQIATRNLAPKPSRNFPFEVWYGYHFDVALVGRFLHKKAVARGVRYQSCHVTHANLNERGDIASVATREGETIEADLFVDCTGFASMLMQKTLQTPYVSFSNNLFNDLAIAMPTPIGVGIPSQTVSAAMKHDWRWQIPLTNRFGNGYVYSSSFCTPDEAETELRARLGLLDSDTPARHLRMKVGRLTKHWNRNCLGVGLSQGFIEPLEATGLLFIQRTASVFVEYLMAGDMSETAQEKFNAQMNRAFECTRDFIVAHYKTSSRSDTEYWRANGANTDLSDSLKQIFSTWLSGKHLGSEIMRQQVDQYFAVVSWYSILAGSGIFPEQKDLRPPEPGMQTSAMGNMEQIDNLIERSLLNFRDHREVLMDIPPRDNKALKVYYF